VQTCTRNLNLRIIIMANFTGPSRRNHSVLCPSTVARRGRPSNRADFIDGAGNDAIDGGGGNDVLLGGDGTIC
jgi:Ca2+-binding RTX toxin-like protein